MLVSSFELLHISVHMSVDIVAPPPKKMIEIVTASVAVQIVLV
jgi:hypothetical protein